MAPAIQPAHRHILVLIAVTWLPLLVLTTATGVAWSNVEYPFCMDIGAQIRLLVGMPLLISGALFLEQRIKPVVAQFTDRELIAPEDRRGYECALEEVARMKRSVVPELLMIAAAFGTGSLLRQNPELQTTTWYGNTANGEVRLTVPGLWYAYVSLPILRLILFRWYFRLALWYWFLWKISRFPLRLNALHPDRAGGLGFLTASLFAFAPLLLAQSIVASSRIGNRIWHEGALLMSFKSDIISVVAFLLLLMLLPHVLFMKQLSRTRRAGLCDYGASASQYVQDFWSKWQRPMNGPQRASFLGTSDIQSLADLSNSFEIVQQMRIMPFGKQAVLRVGALIVLPFVPLAFTIVSVDEMIKHVFKLVL